jgi:N-dimethylarginine dimethylaminohydrolase
MMDLVERTAIPAVHRRPVAPVRELPTLVVSALACNDHDVESDCRYQVAWSINPHMAIGAVDFPAAARQHSAFIAALEAAGARIVPLPFVHGAYDSVFAKDSALLLERRGLRRALLARLRYPERQREQAARAEFYERYGYEVVCEANGPSWEGGDIVMLPSGQSMFLGYGPRSSYEAVEWLERHAGVAVTPLALRDPQLYHLDMALAVLPDGTALVCETALTADSMHALERTSRIREVVTVPRADALAFGLNLVPIGDTSSAVHGSRGSPRSSRRAVIAAGSSRSISFISPEGAPPVSSRPCIAIRSRSANLRHQRTAEAPWTSTGRCFVP